MYQLVHNLLYNTGVEIPAFAFHQFLEVVTVAELHEDVVPCVSFDGLLHLDYVVALYRILVLDFRNDEAFLCLAQILSLHDFTSIKSTNIVKVDRVLYHWWFHIIFVVKVLCILRW